MYRAIWGQSSQLNSQKRLSVVQWWSFGIFGVLRGGSGTAGWFGGRAPLARVVAVDFLRTQIFGGLAESAEPVLRTEWRLDAAILLTLRVSWRERVAKREEMRSTPSTLFLFGCSARSTRRTAKAALSLRPKRCRAGRDTLRA